MRKIFPRFVIIFFLEVFWLSNAFSSEIKIVTWEDLSDRDISPQGKAALSLNRDSWKHAETEHFVYHFADEKEADTVYTHAELYYRWIKEMFGVEKDGWSKKGHVFIFEDENTRKSFNHENGEPLFAAEGFTSGWELFMHRGAFWLTPQEVLAHELTHIIVFRFLDGPIPLFLNEGFAVFMQYKAVSVQADGNEFNLRILKLIPPAEYIPLKTLVGTRNYPAGQVEIFYQESELFVRFLIQTYGNKNFYSLLKKISGGASFEGVLKDIDGAELSDLEEKFKSYALEKT